MLVNNKYSLIFKKLTGHPAFYGLEITAALLLKFTLLGGLWWLFFAGHKQPVDGAVIAGKIYGVQEQAVIDKGYKERLK
jgi:hypothetical protein